MACGIGSKVFQGGRSKENEQKKERREIGTFV